MKTIAKIGGIGLAEVKRELVDELCAIYPEGRTAPNISGSLYSQLILPPDDPRAQERIESLNRRGIYLPEIPEGNYSGLFRSSLLLDDPRAQRLLDALERYGFQPLNDLAMEKQFNTYTLKLSREYDEYDLAEADFLTLNPTPYFDAGRTLEGLLLLVSKDVRKGVKAHVDIAAAAGVGIAVSDRLRHQIEEACFPHIRFGDAMLDNSAGQPTNRPAPYWELTSDLILPPLSARNYIFTNLNKPFDGDYSNGCFLREGSQVPDALYFPPEIHYEASVLKSVVPFDLALTHERIIGGQSHQIGASQRFYQFCRAAKLPIRWMPVRLDS